MARSAKQVASQLKAAKASAAKRRAKRTVRNISKAKSSTRFEIGMRDPLRDGGLFMNKPMTRSERMKNATTKGKKASDIVKTLKSYDAPILSPGQVRKARKAGKIAYGPYEELQGKREAKHRFGRR